MKKPVLPLMLQKPLGFGKSRLKRPDRSRSGLFGIYYSYMESLGKIFGSRHRVKVMRLFLFNQSSTFDLQDVVGRTQTKSVDIRKELNMLTKIGFLRKKNFIKKTPGRVTKNNPNPAVKKTKKIGWTLNARFEMAEPLRVLLLDSELVNEKDLVKRIKKAGTIKLLALSGIFTYDPGRKLDLLIVGNTLKKDILEKEMAILESEIGRELRYAVFTTTEFEYRITMYDKLIRDTMENRHIKLINSITK